MRFSFSNWDILIYSLVLLLLFFLIGRQGTGVAEVEWETTWLFLGYAPANQVRSRGVGNNFLPSGHVPFPLSPSGLAFSLTILVSSNSHHLVKWHPHETTSHLLPTWLSAFQLGTLIRQLSASTIGTTSRKTKSFETSVIPMSLELLYFISQVLPRGSLYPTQPFMD